MFESDLDTFRRRVLGEIQCYLLATGYAAARVGVRDVLSIPHIARFSWEHGGSLWFRLAPGAAEDWRQKGTSVVIEHEHMDGWGRLDKYGTIKVVGMKDWDNFGINVLLPQQVRILSDAVGAMLPEVTWVTRFISCDGPYHSAWRSLGKLDVCRTYGDKWLCEQCEHSFALTMLPDPVPMAGTQEQSERAKMTAAVRWQVLERDGFTCQACGATGPDVKLHVDHKIPIAKGGKTTLDNLHVLCAPCNLGKRDKMPRQETLDLWGLAAD